MLHVILGSLESTLCHTSRFVVVNAMTPLAPLASLSRGDSRFVHKANGWDFKNTGQDHRCKSHGPLPQVHDLLLERVLCCVVLHRWTGAYQGRPLGQQPCHPCKPLLPRFGSAQQTASGILVLSCNVPCIWMVQPCHTGLHPEFDIEMAGKSLSCLHMSIHRVKL